MKPAFEVLLVDAIVKLRNAGRKTPEETHGVLPMICTIVLAGNDQRNAAFDQMATKLELEGSSERARRLWRMGQILTTQ